MLFIKIIVICLLVSFAECHGQIGCKNEQGDDVDMFALYKLPYLKDSPHPLIAKGVAYAYLDASTDYQFVISDLSINSTKSPAGRTLAPVYRAHQDVIKNTNLAHVFYNDATPNGTEYFNAGHTKGTLAFNNKLGFWMIHSVPKYPPIAEKNAAYGYPHSGTYFGQLYICVTFEASQFEKIGYNIRVDNPHIHSASMPPQMAGHFPNMAELVKGKMVRTPPYYSIAQLISAGGTLYEHFSKANHFYADLYHELVAPKLQTNLLAETWQSDKILGPACTNFTVEDSKSIDLKILHGSSVAFTNSKDHSKFVVSKGSAKPYVCIGDINRAVGQLHRGGGTLCVKNSTLWKTFRTSIAKYNSC